VVVSHALEKDLLEEADVASYTKTFLQAKATVYSQFSSLQALF